MIQVDSTENHLSSVLAAVNRVINKIVPLMILF